MANSIDEIVVDVETCKLFSEVEGGRNSLDKLGVGCAVVYSYIDDSYSVYKGDAVGELRERILAADKVTGFNIRNFDYPVIWGMRKAEWLATQEAQRILPKTNDLLRRMWISLGLNPDEFTKQHWGYSLNTIATATLGDGKCNAGEMAPQLLRNGDWDLLVTYCLNDVKLTRDLSGFISKYGYVINGKEDVLRVWAAPDEIV